MIQRCELRNFQSHRETVLEFEPGVNVIVGPSDCGKSAVVRAINWVLTNRPLGDAFRSSWGGDTSVLLVTDDGHTVERRRTDAENLYVVDGERLAAFGADVPDEVTRILMMDEFSIQTQFEPPFMLAASPGDAARLLNKAAKIDDIDRTTRNLHRTQSELSRRIRADEETVADLEKQLEQYKDLEALERELAQAELLEAKCARVGAKLAALRQLVARIQSVERELAEFDVLTDQAAQLEELQASYTAYCKAQERFGRVRSLLDQIRSTRQRLDACEELLQELEGSFEALMPEQCPLCGSVLKES